MESSILSTVILPLSLFVIMLGLGLGLAPKDFKLVLVRPKAVLLGISCQMILLPIIALSIIAIMNLEPVMAMGLMILALCPAGTTSNLYTYIAQGDLALSVTMTAIVSLVTPFTIPLLANFSMEWVLGAGKEFHLSVIETIVKLMVITVIPICIGMVINRKAPKFSRKAEHPVRIFSIAFLALIVLALIAKSLTKMPEYFAALGIATLILNVGSMAAGYWLAKLFVLKRRQAISIGMEVGIQNGTTAIMISLTILGNEVLAIAPTVYSLIMFATGGLFAWWVNRNRVDFEIEGSQNQTA